MKNIVNCLLLIVTFVALVPASAQADPTRRNSYAHTSLGVRLGWVGAPNGLTLRREFAPSQAFEVVAGYSPKYGRHADMEPIRKGNSFLGVSYQPFLRMAERDLGVSIYADLGARLNFHHYRSFSNPVGGSKFTPDLIAGAGMQVEFSEAVEIFGDMHVKYFSNPSNFYAPGVESGLGIRFTL